MKRLASSAAAIGLAALLTSCGGGGDSGSGVPLNASVYTGHYVGICSQVPNATNYETGAALYARMLITVASSSTATAPMETRLDFYDNAACSGEAIGVLRNNSWETALQLVSETMVNGARAHKVTLWLGHPGVPYQPGPTADTVIYGTTLRLKLPAVLVSRAYAREFWSLQGDNIYEGAAPLDANGFPTTLRSTPAGTKVASLPPLPEAPCAPENVYWYTHWGSCSARTMFSASKVTSTLVNIWGTVPGTAEFTCSNGRWSAPANAICGTALVQTICPAHTTTWTSGGNTCSGSVPATVYPSGWSAPTVSSVFVANSTPGYTGTKVLGCQSDGSWTVTYPGNCDVPPPPPPPPATPQELAQAKNCLACHTVLEPGYSADLPSFERIANHYRSSPPAAGVLEAKIKAGGAGTFGTTPMPANPQVTDADLAILVPWILAQPQ